MTEPQPSPEIPVEPSPALPDVRTRLQALIHRELRVAYDRREFEQVAEGGVTPDEALDATVRDATRRADYVRGTGQGPSEAPSGPTADN